MSLCAICGIKDLGPEILLPGPLQKHGDSTNRERSGKKNSPFVLEGGQ